MEENHSLPSSSKRKTIAAGDDTAPTGTIRMPKAIVFSYAAVRGLINSDSAEVAARVINKLPRYDKMTREKTPSSPCERKSKEVAVTSVHPFKLIVTPQKKSMNILQPKKSHLLLPPLWTDVLCMKVVDDSLYLGCSDGSIVTIDLISLDIIDKCHPHDGPVVVLLYWRRCIIAASSNGCISLVDLELKRIKKFSTGVSITCGDNDPFGLLFFGTDSGTIIKVNALAMTLLNKTLNIGETNINIIVYVDNLREKKTSFKTPLLFVLADQKATLRNIDNGALLFTVIDPCSFGFYCSSENSIFTCGSFISRFDIFVGSEVTSTVAKLHKPCTAAVLHKNHIIISNADGVAYILTKDLKNCVSNIHLMDSTPISMLASWKNHVISYFPEKKRLSIATTYASDIWMDFTS